MTKHDILQSLGLWLAHWVPSMAAGSQSRVSGLMVLTRFAALATFFPIGNPISLHMSLLQLNPYFDIDMTYLICKLSIIVAAPVLFSTIKELMGLSAL